MQISDDKFTLAEEPYTNIQGEGRFVGIPMTYVRMQGCNVGCVWCDSYYTWSPYNMDNVPKSIISTPIEVNFQELADRIRREGCRHVWFTGGEPMLQHDAIRKFLQQHRALDKKYHICTAGLIMDESLVDLLDFITIDVKAPTSKVKVNIQKLERYVQLAGNKLEFKMVVANNNEDRVFAMDFVRRFKNVAITLQPLYTSEIQIMNEGLAPNLMNWELDRFAEWINNTFRDYNKVRMGLQLHKSIWKYRTRGI